MIRPLKYLRRFRIWRWLIRHRIERQIAAIDRACSTWIPSFDMNDWEDIEDIFRDGPIILDKEASDRLDEIIANPSGPLPDPPLGFYP